MKKSIYIVLIIALFLQTGGLMLIFRLQQYYVKHEMSKVLKDNETVYEEFTLSLAEYRESRVNSGEILYKGEMYDIKSEIVSGDYVSLLVINDSREKDLKEKINALSGGRHQNNQDIPNKILKLYTLSFLFPQNILIKDFISCSDNTFPSFRDNYISIKQDILSPPPELI